MKHTKEYYESFIGKTFKGFKFDKTNRGLYYNDGMDNLIGADFEIIRYNKRYNSFETHLWSYPADLVIEQILQSDKPKFTIEDLANGKCAVVNDGTVEELIEVLYEAEPKSKGTVIGTSKYYYTMNGYYWNNENENVQSLPTQSVKEFLKDIKQPKSTQFLHDKFGIKENKVHIENPIEPEHYTQFAIQPIDYIEANKLDFFEGNVVKYVSRYKSKNGLEDLKKAQVYLQRLIDRYESK